MAKFDVVCIGVALLDSIIRGFDPEPVSASGFRAESGSLVVGGEAVNSSVTMAKLGMRTGILCFLGEDPAGRIVEENLVQNGVSTELIVWEKEHPTPVTSMFVKTDGSRQSVTNLAHKYNFHPERFGIEKLDARAIVLDSLFRAPFDEPEVIFRVASEAKAAGMKVFADTKIPNFRKLRAEDIAKCFPLIDYITPNEDEAQFYSGRRKPEEMADYFLDLGVSNVVIKLGEKGCFFKNAKETIILSGFEIRAVDSTGAGDNFLAGFLSDILEGRSHEEALMFANACGAISATEIGAGAGVKNRTQVEDFLKEMGLRE